MITTNSFQHKHQPKLDTHSVVIHRKFGEGKRGLDRVISPFPTQDEAIAWVKRQPIDTTLEYSFVPVEIPRWL